ncbi:hypothetical protein M721_03125, partial [Neisseria gonorrhoeae ALB_2011_03_03]
FNVECCTILFLIHYILTASKGKNNVSMLRLPLFEMTNKMPSETRFPVSDGI